jgi:hypothetical protein
VTSRDDREADEAALAALADSYASAVDRRDGDALAALFTDDGVLVVAALPDGSRPEAVHAGRTRLARIPGLLGGYEWTLHQVVDRHYRLGAPGADDPDAATGVVRSVAHHVRRSGVGAGAGTDTVWYLHYLDRYRREGGRWRIERRVLELEWTEERPVASVAQRDGTGWGGGGPT